MQIEAAVSSFYSYTKVVVWLTKTLQRSFQHFLGCGVKAAYTRKQPENEGEDGEPR